MKHATFTERILAGLLEQQIYWLVTIAYFFGLSATVVDGQGLVSGLLFGLVVVVWIGVLQIFYSAYFTSHFGGQLGKIIVGIQVVKKDSKDFLDFNLAFFRQTVGYVVSSLAWGLGYYWVLRNPEKQAWHDMLVDSVVIKTDSGSMFRTLGSSLILVALFCLNLVLTATIINNFYNNKGLAGEFSSQVQFLQSVLKDK